MFSRYTIQCEQFHVRLESHFQSRQLLCRSKRGSGKIWGWGVKEEGAAGSMAECNFLQS